MLVTAERTATCARALPELLAWCQSAYSRANWPGVERIKWDDTTRLPRLYYDVRIAAPGAPESVANVEEHMCRPEEDDDGIFFEAAQLWKWESGQVAGCWATYRFSEVPGGTAVPEGTGEGGTRFGFTFRYLLPDLGAPEVFARDRFERTIERAVQLYVERVVLGGATVSPADAADG